MAKPKVKYSAGQITAALWENEITVNGRKVTMLKATVQRRYKDGKDGQWKSSTSFSRNEIPLVIYTLQKCYEYMIEGQKEEESGSVEEETIM